MNPVLFASVTASALALLLLVASRRPAWIVRFPRVVMAGVLAISVAAAFAIVDWQPLRLALHFDPSTDPLLPSGDPAREQYRRAVLSFGDDEVYVIAVSCSEVFSVPCLSAMKRVSGEISRLPGVRRVRSLVDVTSFGYRAEDDWVEVRPFIEEIPQDTRALAALRDRALASPLYRRVLVSDDGRTAAINVSFRKMSDALFISRGLDARIQKILAQESQAGMQFFVAGRPHVKTRVYEGMIRDLERLIPLSLVAVGIVLWLAIRTRRAVVLPIAVSALACLWTFGALALLGRSVTLLSGLLGPTLLAVGSVYGVHFLARFEEEATGAADSSEAVRRCLEHLVLPVGIAGLTTVAGFGALLVTDVPAVFELGAFAVFGVASITLLSLSFVPALLVLLPFRERPMLRAERLLGRLLASLARFVERRAGSISAAFLAGLVAALLAIPFIQVDTDYLSYLREKDPVRLDFERVNRLLAGAVPIYAVLEGDRAGAFREPAVLRAVEAAERRMGGVPGVGRSLSVIDSLRVLNRAFAADDPAEERIPDTRGEVSELLFLLPKGDSQRLMTVDHRQLNVIVRTGEVGSSAVRRLASSLEAALFAEPLPQGIRAFVTGNAILLSRSADGIARSQPLTVGLAAAAILLLITAGLGSLRLGLIAMVPNLVPVLFFFGLLGFGAAPLSLPTSLIGSVALGIAIDDTVHYLVRYRAERREGATPHEAARRCTRVVGRPIAITSVMLTLGFLVVALSDFASLREFGALSALTMLLCLGADLVLLPALLIRARV